MTLHQFAIFAAVAKCGNVTHASQELSITQPCVSQQMRLLQAEYGARLYRRGGQGVELTEAGQHFLAAITPILDQVKQLRTSSAQALAGPEPKVLAVGGTHSPSTILLPSLLSRYKRLHPDAEIDLRTNNGQEIERLLLNHTIEIAVTMRPPNSARITMEPLRREKLAFVVSRRHPLAGMRKPTLYDIERTPLLVRSSTGSDGNKHLKTLTEGIGIKVTVSMRFESPAALNHAIQNNMGIGMVYEDEVKYHLKRGEFKVIKVPGLNLQGQSYIIYLNDKPLSTSAMEFLNLLRTTRSRRDDAEFSGAHPVIRNGIPGSPTPTPQALADIV
jgi:DNA-binding transcriptional LysR family regulator